MEGVLLALALMFAWMGGSNSGMFLLGRKYDWEHTRRAGHFGIGHSVMAVVCALLIWTMQAD